MQHLYVMCVSSKPSVPSPLDHCCSQHGIVLIIFSTQRCRDSSLFIANGPSASLQECASRTEALAVVLIKVVTLVFDCDLLINVNVLYSDYLNVIFCEAEFHIGFTIMVGEVSGAEEQQDRFLAAGCDNSEVTTCCD